MDTATRNFFSRDLLRWDDRAFYEPKLRSLSLILASRLYKPENRSYISLLSLLSLFSWPENFVFNSASFIVSSTCSFILNIDSRLCFYIIYNKHGYNKVLIDYYLRNYY